MRLKPGAVSFDLDDTLWACDDVIERAERAVYDWLCRHAPRVTAQHDREAMRALRVETARARPELAADLTALRRVTVAWHAEAAGYPAGLADAAVDVFLAERNRVTPFDDVRPVLERLRRRYPLVALTNGNADVGRTGLGDLFSEAVSSADVGAAKPDPAMFAEACRRLGLRAGDLVHVGDDPVRDVHAARAFGARAVWIDRFGSAWPEGIPRAHHELETLHDLAPLLDHTSAAG
ncbi:MAG: HAD family hydrolase [Halofilum sp. (in: g-proteobacteria)]|nr:HAD family hydrolase [Halofilum sp. (in: g-proteobacteria)]